MPHRVKPKFIAQKEQA